MPLVVLRYKDSSVLPYVLSVAPDGLVPTEWRDSGWSIDAEADPSEVAAAIQEAQDNAVAQAAAHPPRIRFASDDADTPNPSPEPSPSPSPSPNPPAEPASEGN